MRSRKKIKVYTIGEEPKKAKSGGIRTFVVDTRADGRLSVSKVTTCDSEGEDELSDWEQILLQPDPDNSGPEHEGSRREMYKTKSKGRGAAHLRLQDWLPRRETYLDAILYHEAPHHIGRSLVCQKCTSKQSDASLYRCMDCLFLGLLCASCMLDRHDFLPFHRIEIWTGTFFDKSSLYSLGQYIQLGHWGNKCPTPVCGPEKFVVMDSNGYHFVRLSFCDCHPPKPRGIQLLEAKLFPASTDRPATAFTFELLDSCEELSLQGKTNVYDFYNALVNKTGKDKRHPLDKYKDLIYVMRLWRHLLMLKRSGRAHEPFGVTSTGPGQLAVECPACPHPNRNLPIDWSARTGKRWLYTQFLAVDANFKLKLKNKGLKDLELAPGWGYFVEEDAYQATVAKYGADTETNTCRSQHNAILAANIRGTRNYKATGTGAVMCGRHSLMCKNGVGDLQRGERYANMDYMILSVLKDNQVQDVVISYDIACQWSKNFLDRIRRYPEHIQVDISDINLRAVVPKFHLPAHGPQCQTRFSLNFLPNVGRTYGEGVESGWANTNGAATSTREMGPGLRHETLNDYWGAWNWKKVLGFGDHLLKQLNLAITWKKEHQESLRAMSATVRPEHVSEWTRMIKAWYQDPSTAEDPFAEPVIGTSLNAVRKQFSDEDADEVKRGEVSVRAVTARSFISTGLELEERQRKFKIRNVKETGSDRLVANAQNVRTSLLRQIKQWQCAQDVHMPLVAAARSKKTTNEKGSNNLSNGSDDESHADDDDADDDLAAEDIPLFLPSEDTTLASEDLRSLEVRLRRAQTDDALETIRQQRRAMAGLAAFRRRNVYGTGNKANTRTQTLYKKMQEKINIAKFQYRTARLALASLEPNAGWKTTLQELKDEDIRGPDLDEEDEASQQKKAKKRKAGRGYDKPSWIWIKPGANFSSAKPGSQFRDSVRFQWAKTYACVDRWDEELELVCEEMRRVLAFLVWKSNWWLGQRGRLQDDRSDFQACLDAYAYKQSSVFSRLASSFAHKWIPFVKQHTTASWVPEFEHLVKQETRQDGAPSRTKQSPSEYVEGGGSREGTEEGGRDAGKDGIGGDGEGNNCFLEDEDFD